MIYKAISLALVALLLHGSVAAQAQQQSTSQTLPNMQQVLRKAQEKDKAVKVTLKTKIDNQSQLSGKVSEISDTGFTLTDQKAGKTMKLAYEDVQQVNQKGMSKGWKIALVVIAGVIVIVAWVAVVAALTGGFSD